MANWGLYGFVKWHARILENMLPTYGFKYGFTACHDQTNGCDCKKVCKSAGPSNTFFFFFFLKKKI
jgi:hypothetical protein